MGDPHACHGRATVAATDCRDEAGRPLRILSLGAGVQSSTLLLMALAGELPRLDAAILLDNPWVRRVRWWAVALRACCDQGTGEFGSLTSGVDDRSDLVKDSRLDRRL